MRLKIFIGYSWTISSESVVELHQHGIKRMVLGRFWLNWPKSQARQRMDRRLTGGDADGF